MDHESSSQLDAEFVTGESSVKQNRNPIPAPPPGSPETELLGWQTNSSFMANYLAAANEQPPAGHYLPAPAAPDNYLPMLPRLPLVIPVSQLLPVPFSEPPPPPLLAYPLPLPLRERDYHQLEAVPEEEELGGAAQEADDNEFLAVQSSQTGGDEQGEQPFLPPPLFTLSDVMTESCIILQKKMKMMNFAACQDKSGIMTVMPKVTATGDGDFGKKIEGFMFQYGKKTGELVGLMCFCHGYILTPPEFIKHAGGTPVSDPLTQIQVYIPTVAIYS